MQDCWLEPDLDYWDCCECTKCIEANDEKQDYAEMYHDLMKFLYGKTVMDTDKFDYLVEQLSCYFDKNYEFGKLINDGKLVSLHVA